MVEVTNSANPVFVKTIRHPTSNSTNTPEAVKVYNNVLFVAQNFQPTYWVDLTAAVDAPGTSTAGYKGDITTGMRIHNIFVNKDQQLLFLARFEHTFNSRAYDISGVPTSAPVFKGEIPQLISGARSHDLYVRKTGTTTGRVYDAVLAGLIVSDYTWSSGSFSVGTQRIHKYNPYRGKAPNDFSAPIIPENKRTAHGTWLGAGSNYLFSTEEQGGGSNSEPYWWNPDSIQYKRGNHLYVWDISNIDAAPDANSYRYPIKQVYEVRENNDNGSFASPPTPYFTPLSLEKANSIHNIVSRGSTAADTLYVAYYTKGIRVLNITDPTTMSEIAYYDTPGLSQYYVPVYNGPWDVDPFLPSANILAISADGLYVFRPTGIFAGTISVNTRWTNQITVLSNVTVAAGVTLTIDPGTTVKFCGGASLIINGSLVADSNDPTKRITFTGTTATPGFWQSIVINASSTASTLRRCDVKYAVDGIDIFYTGNTNNVTIDKCKITNNSADGIYIDGGAYSGATVHPVISNSTISNNYGGIELASYAMPTIGSYNRIENNSAFGIFGDSNCNAKVQYNYIYNNGTHGLWFVISSNAEVHRNTIKNNGTRGITCASNSNLIANGADTTKGRNEIASNSGVGIYASSCSPNFGKDFSGIYGNNWIHDNTSYEAQQTGSGYTLWAQRCYWSGQQTNVSGNVSTSPVLSSQPSPVGWGRSSTYDPTLRIGTQAPIIAMLNPSEFEHAMSGSSSMAKSAMASVTAINWTTELQAAIVEGRNTGNWSKASNLLAALHRELQEARVPDVDFALVNAYANDLTIAAFIRKMLALALMEKDLIDGDISAALTKLAAFKQSNAENAAEFLANAGVIHLYRQNDLAAAQAIFSQLQTLAKNGDTVAVELVDAFNIILPRYQRQQAMSSQSGGMQKPMIASLETSTLPRASSLAQNYPNPFNPTTIIRFHLSERQQVRLVIFDITGQRVRTLVEGELPAGEQTISWDGRDQRGTAAASGVYFYELAMHDKIERKKMTLVR